MFIDYINLTSTVTILYTKKNLQYLTTQNFFNVTFCYSILWFKTVDILNIL